jgi:cytochrome b involved in lipid metabolism
MLVRDPSMEPPSLTRLTILLSGKDADDMFEDIGHSAEARNIMKKYVVGTVKDDGTLRSATKAKKSAATFGNKKGGLNPIAVLVLLIAIAAGIYYSQMQK